MLVELERFVEFGDDWWKHDPGRREDMVFETMTINLDYVATARRWGGPKGFDFCDVHMADRGCVYVLDITYEDMRKLLKPIETGRAA
jgi:hypothetical protein